MFLKSFFHLVETQISYKIKVIRYDSGTKFNMDSFFSSKCVIHRLSYLYTPQQNRVVKRKHQHFLNVARALHFQSNISLKFWDDCVMTSTYLINRTPSPFLYHKTPYEMLYAVKTSYSHLNVFGCLCCY